jgi:hypothetical protein
MLLHRSLHMNVRIRDNSPIRPNDPCEAERHFRRRKKQSLGCGTEALTTVIALVSSAVVGALAQRHRPVVHRTRADLAAKTLGLVEQHDAIETIDAGARTRQEDPAHLWAPVEHGKHLGICTISSTESQRCASLVTVDRTTVGRRSRMTESSPVLSDVFDAEGPPPLELVQAIDALRAQLTVAVERSRGQRIRFDLGEVEIEFTVSLTRDAKAEGGVKIWVLSLGASGARSSAAAQRLKVTLKPTDTHTGQSPQIADRIENSLPD